MLITACEKTGLKVAYTSGPIFEKNYQAVPHFFFTDKLQSDWSKA